MISTAPPTALYDLDAQLQQHVKSFMTMLPLTCLRDGLS